MPHTSFPLPSFFTPFLPFDCGTRTQKHRNTSGLSHISFFLPSLHFISFLHSRFNPLSFHFCSLSETIYCIPLAGNAINVLLFARREKKESKNRLFCFGQVGMREGRQIREGEGIVKADKEKEARIERHTYTSRQGSKERMLDV